MPLAGTVSRMSGMIRIVKLAVGGALLGLVLAGYQATSLSMASGSTVSLGHLQLSKVLPTKTYLSVGGAQTRNARWEAFAYPRRIAGHKKLCLQIVAVHRVRGMISVTPGSPECGSVQPAIEEPVAVASSMRRLRQLVVVVATGTPASRIIVTVTPSREIGAEVKALPQGQVKRLGVGDFGYAVVVAHGEDCINQIRGFEGDGEVAFATLKLPCSTGP